MAEKESCSRVNNEFILNDCGHHKANRIKDIVHLAEDFPFNRRRYQGWEIHLSVVESFYKASTAMGNWEKRASRATATWLRFAVP